jgi:hypothetical protein
MVSITCFRQEIAVGLSQQSGRRVGYEVEERRDKVELKRINWNLGGKTGDVFHHLWPQ